jgi:hypothetical protein
VGTSGAHPFEGATFDTMMIMAGNKHIANPDEVRDDMVCGHGLSFLRRTNCMLLLLLDTVFVFKKN